MTQKIQELVPGMNVHHAEACRGVDRLRRPVSLEDPHLVTHRKTIVMHRNTRQVEEVGPIEDWSKLPRYKQIRAGKPARIALTIFGVGAASHEVGPAQEDMRPPSSSPENRVPVSVEGERPCQSEQSAEPSEATTKVAWGPPPVANHGPGVLRLNPKEKADIRQLHHNLGHPDPQKFARYLKQGGACEEVIRGAQDYQCDACVESQRGFKLARPASIHDNIPFNQKVGIDLVSWKNGRGKEFRFVHFLDEGTLFHVGAECLQGTEEVIALFEQCWVTWAGNPIEVYVDPGSEFTSEQWAIRMQESGTRVNMSAADARWQLGRTEIHGSTVKKMLTKMDAQAPIDSSVEFQRALRQAFQAKNSLSPQQAVLGVAARLPGSITSDTEAASHALADSETPEGQRFLESLKIREQARTAFIQVDNSASFRRALLRRTRTERLDWEPGDYVLCWRRRGGNLRREHGRWHGPGKIIWISHAGRLI